MVLKHCHALKKKKKKKNTNNITVLHRIHKKEKYYDKDGIRTRALSNQWIVS